MDNRTILEKADLALSELTSGGGLLLPAQAKQFIRILIDESVIMKHATVTPMRSPKQEIEKIRFGSRILRAGQEATALALGDRTKPTLSKVELDAQLFKAEVRISDEILEDSIERDQLRNTIMQLMAERISVDMDEVIVQGDGTSADLFLKSFAGMIKLSTSNVVPVSPIAPLDKTVLKNMLKAMPSPFLRNKKAMRYFTSIDARLDYVDMLADRQTPLGDANVSNENFVQYSGVPIIEVPLFPENLGGATNETDVILTDPKNINVGVWRKIKVATEQLISEGVLKIVATMRFCFEYQEETAVVKATGIKVG